MFHSGARRMHRQRPVAGYARMRRGLSPGTGGMRVVRKFL